MSSSDFEQFLALAEQELPQFPHIKKANAKRWFDSLKGDPIHGLDWHFWRLKRLGGSEGGVIVANVLGEPAPFDTYPVDIYRRKLMIDPLEESTPAMIFGNEKEDETQALFESSVADQYGWRRADDLRAQLRAAIRSKDYVFPLGYTEDDLFYDENNDLILVDYKTPYRKEVPEYSPLEYASQLHQGRIVFKEALGVDIKQTILAYGVHPKSFLRSRTKELFLEVFEVDYDDNIHNILMEEATKFIRGHVWAGVEPNQDTLVVAKQLEELDREYTALRIEEKDSKAEAEVVGSRMSEIIAGLDETKRKEVVSRMDTYARPSVTEVLPSMTDEEIEKAIKEKLGDYVDVDKFKKKEETSYDAEALKAELLKLNPDFDLKPFEVKKITWNKNEILDKGVVSKDDLTTKVTWSLSKKTLAEIGNISPASEGSSEKRIGEETSNAKKGLSPE